MFKYEVEIADFNQRYLEAFAPIRNIFNRPHESTEYSVPHRFSGSTIQAVQKYYTFIEGQGYIKIEINIDNRNDRDLFEKNNIDYPHEGGLYLIGQTFFNPITDEKFYWIKVGTGSDLKRRRRDYNTPTAMIWDIGYYLNNDLTESGCHQKLKTIALHRHADEWFSISRENYLAICEQGFDWFKEA